MSDVVERLRAIWQEVLPGRQIGIDDELPNLGGQSMTVIKIAVRIEETFGIDIPLEILLERTTLRLVAEAIDALQRTEARS